MISFPAAAEESERIRVGLLEGSIHATQFYDWETKEAGVTAFCEKPLFMSQLRELLSNPVPKEKAP